VRPGVRRDAVLESAELQAVSVEQHVSARQEVVQKDVARGAVPASVG